MISGDASRASTIDDFDLSTIIPNMLNNAIEATLSVIDEERVISVDFKNIQNKILIIVSNPVSEIVNIKALNEVKTTKKDRINHGFGIKNIISSANKYKGTVTYEMEGNSKFVLSVALRI